MEKMDILLSRSKEVLQKEGVLSFCKRTKNYVTKVAKNKNRLGKDLPEQTYMDVLFVNGCYLPHPSRYRVTHQREQLLAGNVTSNEVWYEDITMDMVKNYRVFILYRCPFTKKLGEWIEKAKYYGKTVLFDIDDLVIDKRYTKDIKYLSTLSVEERKRYDHGVCLIQKTLRLCDGAITTTERLQTELSRYVKQVYINRNVASDRMVELSEQALYYKRVYVEKRWDQLGGKQDRNNFNKLKTYLDKRKKGSLALGYFSGSITHNDDFFLILPAIVRLLHEFPALQLFLIGDLDLPKVLEQFRDRIVIYPFVKWELLPYLIASVDINLAPLESSIFNEAKSENKWVEAALVKVPTVASDVGAFHNRIIDGETGILCSDHDWYDTLKMLLKSKVVRKNLGEQAYHDANHNCVTMFTSTSFSSYIKQQMKPNIAFVLPTTQISGGVLVAIKHSVLLKKNGFDVLFISESEEEKSIVSDEMEFPVISKWKTGIFGSFDKVVATLWATLDFVQLYPNIKERYYLVQGYETNFYKSGEFFRFRANQTYSACFPLTYLTISKWCETWLRKTYGQTARYAPNGLDCEKFIPHKRSFGKKIRILIEGNSNDFYKNVDESFQIVEKLDKTKFEIWYMSYQGLPKKNYYVDRFLHKVPNSQVNKVYKSCDILLKSTILESFSYPPLEMMATGGYAVVVPNEGNVEYLKHEENCLFYKQGDIDAGIEAIERIIADPELRKILYQNGIETARKRDWKLIEDKIIQLYS